jgi:hypothetical protein
MACRYKTLSVTHKNKNNKLDLLLFFFVLHTHLCRCVRLVSFYAAAANFSALVCLEIVFPRFRSLASPALQAGLRSLLSRWGAAWCWVGGKTFVLKHLHGEEGKVGRRGR